MVDRWADRSNRHRRRGPAGVRDGGWRRRVDRGLVVACLALQTAIAGVFDRGQAHNGRSLAGRQIYYVGRLQVAVGGRQGELQAIPLQPGEVEQFFGNGGGLAGRQGDGQFESDDVGRRVVGPLGVLLVAFLVPIHIQILDGDTPRELGVHLSGENNLDRGGFPSRMRPQVGGVDRGDCGAIAGNEFDLVAVLDHIERPGGLQRLDRRPNCSASADTIPMDGLRQCAGEDVAWCQHAGFRALLCNDRPQRRVGPSREFGLDDVGHRTAQGQAKRYRNDCRIPACGSGIGAVCSTRNGIRIICPYYAI